MANERTEGEHLEEIPTLWGLLEQAHHGSVTAAGPARDALVLRYASAIRRYVGSLLHHEQDADEVAQDVIVRLLRGQFAAAHPERGSFRRMLMVATHNLVRTHWSRKQRRAALGLDNLDLAADPEPSALEEQGTATWRQTVLDMAWKALEEYERAHPGCIAWTLLRMRAEHPEESSEQLASRLSHETGKPFRADALRQQLRRSRVRFARALLEEVARSLDEPTPERVEEELIAIGLMEYVQPFLPPRWRSHGELPSSSEPEA
jgi:hypothetical protein